MNMLYARRALFKIMCEEQKVTIKDKTGVNKANVPIIFITKTQYAYLENNCVVWANFEDVVDLYTREGPAIAPDETDVDMNGILT